MLDAPPLAEEIAQDPVLRNLKLAAAVANPSLLPRSGERGFPHWGIWMQVGGAPGWGERVESAEGPGHKSAAGWWWDSHEEAAEHMSLTGALGALRTQATGSARCTLTSLSDGGYGTGIDRARPVVIYLTASCQGHGRSWQLSAVRTSRECLRARCAACTRSLVFPS